jgi:hypothetical protein
MVAGGELAAGGGMDATLTTPAGLDGPPPETATVCGRACHARNADITTTTAATIASARTPRRPGCSAANARAPLAATPLAVLVTENGSRHPSGAPAGHCDPRDVVAGHVDPGDVVAGHVVAGDVVNGEPPSRSIAAASGDATPAPPSGPAEVVGDAPHTRLKRCVTNGSGGWSVLRTPAR